MTGSRRDSDNSDTLQESDDCEQITWQVTGATTPPEIPAGAYRWEHGQLFRIN